MHFEITKQEESLFNILSELIVSYLYHEVNRERDKYHERYDNASLKMFLPYNDFARITAKYVERINDYFPKELDEACHGIYLDWVFETTFSRRLKLNYNDYTDLYTLTFRVPQDKATERDEVYFVVNDKNKQKIENTIKVWLILELQYIVETELRRPPLYINLNVGQWLKWREHEIKFKKGISPETLNTFGDLFDAL